MSDTFAVSRKALDILQGTWKGVGRGQFPGVTSFGYCETLIFTRRDEKTLAYEQRTQKLYDGQTEYLESHWENGFIKILENRDLELSDVQSSGRSEVLIGRIEKSDTAIRIDFTSKSFGNDTRMVSSARTFVLEGDTLRYTMEMQTTKVDQSTPHLKISLQRIK
jgi:hypothetical protein